MFNIFIGLNQLNNDDLVKIKVDLLNKLERILQTVINEQKNINIYQGNLNSLTN